MFDALISAIDKLLAFVGEASGTRPHADFETFLVLDQEVGALCGATGIDSPQITYVGNYGDRPAGFCKLPVSRNTAGVRFWQDPGWSIAMQGLRRCAELKAEDRKHSLKREEVEHRQPQAKEREARTAKTSSSSATVSDARLSADALREQIRQVDSAESEKRRRAELDSEHFTHFPILLREFTDALYHVAGQANEASRTGRAFDPTPDMPQLTSRLQGVLQGLWASGRMANLDDLDLDGVCEQAYRSGGYGPKEKIRLTLVFVAQRLRGTAEAGISLESLVKELCDPSLYPAGQMFHLLLRVLGGLNRFPAKAGAMQQNERTEGEFQRGIAQWRTGPPAGASGGQAGEDESPNADESDPTTFEFVPIASDVPDLGTADSKPALWDWCHRHREGLRQMRLRLGEPPPARMAPAEFRVIPEIVRQCRNHLTGLGMTGMPDRFSFPNLPLDQTPSGPEHFPSPMEEFVAWASRYRVPGHPIMKLIGEVEEFLSWAMGWCRQQESRAEDPMLPASETELPAKSPAPAAEKAPPPSDMEANLLIRRYLKEHPTDYSIRKASAATGISTGRISGLSAWIVRPPRTATDATNTRSNRRERQLTEAILVSVGVEADPSDQASLREAAWLYAEKNAQDEKDRRRLRNMTPAEREEVIASVIEHFDKQSPE
jgi:hypothetical protein